MKLISGILFFSAGISLCNAQNAQLKIDWSKQVSISNSTPTLQVVGNPMLRRKAAMHDASFTALKNLQADYVRYVPWFPYPRLAVAELEAPGAKTSWDFSLIDPMTIDFLESTKGHPVIMNFSTIPQWMFKTDQPVVYPADPNLVCWNYSQGTELRDSSLKELTGYYIRLISWYTKGGFTDELGKYHKSGYHYDIPYWEVLNEPDLEHNISPQTYTRIYDAMVTALRGEFPAMKFVGLALAYEKPEWFEYFLNPANHKPGIPIDLISYHCYANANSSQKFGAYEYSVFDKAENFVSTVSFIESIRKRLAPRTKTDIDELGTFVSDEMRGQPITPVYFNLSASVYAYFFIALSRAGIDIIGESQLVGYPTQFPDVTMINYVNNKPNARFQVLKLIKDAIVSGSVLLKTDIDSNTGDDLVAQAFTTGSATGDKKVLLLNKRNRKISLNVPAEFNGARIQTIDVSTGDHEASSAVLSGNTVELEPFAVKLITPFN